jgi:hypothetical protein
MDATMMAPTIDPDCRDGKHQACVGDPCDCTCHPPRIHKTVFVPGTLVEAFQHGGFLHVGHDPKVPMCPAVWHLSGNQQAHDVMVVGTGTAMPDDFTYLGTAPDPSGLVWHVLTREIQPPF